MQITVESNKFPYFPALCLLLIIQRLECVKLFVCVQIHKETSGGGGEGSIHSRVTRGCMHTGSGSSQKLVSFVHGPYAPPQESIQLSSACCQMEPGETIPDQ